MPDGPAETLNAAAQLSRNRAAAMHPGVGLALADLLEHAAKDFEMCERQNSRDPYNDGKTRVLPHHIAASALVLARALFGAES